MTRSAKNRFVGGLLAVLVGVSLAVSGCSRGPLKATKLQLGRAINSDKSVGTPASRFAPEQTVYVAILTEGAGSGELSAKWTFNGRVIREEKKSVSYTSDAATEFHVSYAGGFPLGDYKVEVFVDGRPFETRNFRIATS